MANKNTVQILSKGNKWTLGPAYPQPDVTMVGATAISDFEIMACGSSYTFYYKRLACKMKHNPLRFEPSNTAIFKCIKLHIIVSVSAYSGAIRSTWPAMRLWEGGSHSKICCSARLGWGQCCLICCITEYLISTWCFSCSCSLTCDPLWIYTCVVFTCSSAWPRQWSTTWRCLWKLKVYKTLPDRLFVRQGGDCRLRRWGQQHQGAKVHHRWG